MHEGKKEERERRREGRRQGEERKGLPYYWSITN
jgi:hypothetical protein